MPPNSLGYQKDPPNGEGVIRARTTGQLRSWDVPRRLKALETVHSELGQIEYPSVYILFGGKRKVYVGEAKNFYNRIKGHLQNPEEKIEEWDRVLIINDGRPAGTSVLNDSVVRESLELYLIKLFRANRYHVVSQGQEHKLNESQRHVVNAFTEELNFFLQQKNLITKLIETSEQEEVLIDDLKRLLEDLGVKIEDWGALEAVINGEKTFIRHGSKKPKGWQITFRDRFKEALQEGNGRLLIRRGDVPFIPMKAIQNVIVDPHAYKQNTIDVYVTFGESEIKLSYKDKTIEITEFKLRK